MVAGFSEQDASLGGTSKENIADAPSRESYSMLEELGAVWKSPRLAKIYTGAECDGFLTR